MPIAYGRGGTFTATTSPITQSVVINAGETVLVRVSTISGTGGVTSIVGGGAYTKQGEVTNGTLKVETWATAAGAATAATSVVVTISGTFSDADVQVVAETGVVALGPTTSNTGTGTAATIAVVTQDANNVVSAGMAVLSTSAITNTAGTNRLSDSNVSIGAGTSDNTAASPGTVTNTFANGSAAWAVMATELRTVAGTTASRGLQPTRFSPVRRGPRTRGPTLNALRNAAYVVAAATSVLAGAGDVSANGFAPAIGVSVNQSVVPGVAAGTMAGFAATLALPVTVSTGVGSMVTTGLPPVATPSTNQTVGIGVGSIAVDGLASAVSATANQAVLAGLGATTLTGFAPAATTTGNQAVGPDVGPLALAGYASALAITANVTVLSDTGAVNASSVAPAVVASDQRQVTPGVADLTLTSAAPSIGAGTTILPAVGTVVLASGAPDVVPTQAVYLAPDGGVVVSSGFAPVITGAIVDVPPPPVVVSAGGWTPRPQHRNTQSAIAVISDAGTLRLASSAPDVSVSAHAHLNGEAAGASLAGFAPSLTIADGQAPTVPVRLPARRSQAVQLVPSPARETRSFCQMVAVRSRPGRLGATGHAPAISASGDADPALTVTDADEEAILIGYHYLTEMT